MPQDDVMIIDDDVPELEEEEEEEEEEEVQTVLSKWLNDNGMHELLHEFAGTYSPKGLVTKLKTKPGAVFLKYFEPRIVTKKGHVGLGACGLHWNHQG